MKEVLQKNYNTGYELYNNSEIHFPKHYYCTNLIADNPVVDATAVLLAKHCCNLSTFKFNL